MAQGYDQVVVVVVGGDAIHTDGIIVVGDDGVCCICLGNCGGETVEDGGSDGGGVVGVGLVLVEGWWGSW